MFSGFEIVCNVVLQCFSHFQPVIVIWFPKLTVYRFRGLLGFGVNLAFNTQRIYLAIYTVYGRQSEFVKLFLEKA